MPHAACLNQHAKPATAGLWHLRAKEQSPYAFPRRRNFKLGRLQVIDELNGNPAVLRKLKDFEYKDASGKDWGLNVRHRAKELAVLVSDPERMRTERTKVCLLGCMMSMLVPDPHMRVALCQHRTCLDLSASGLPK